MCYYGWSLIEVMIMNVEKRVRLILAAIGSGIDRTGMIRELVSEHGDTVRTWSMVVTKLISAGKVKQDGNKLTIVKS